MNRAVDRPHPQSRSRPCAPHSPIRIRLAIRAWSRRLRCSSCRESAQSIPTGSWLEHRQTRARIRWIML